MHSHKRSRVPRSELIALACVVAALLACKKDEEPTPTVEVKGNQGNVEVKGSGDKGSGTVDTPVGKIGATAGECKAGETCKCSGLGACSKSCPGGGCKFECAAIGACAFDCPGGKCTVLGTATGAVSLKCAGGDCTMKCSGTGACNIESCKSGCSAECTGVGTCSCASGCK